MAVRRRETRSQRQDRRVRPWCPLGGRGRAVERWDFLWGQYVVTQGLVPPLRGRSQAGEGRACARGGSVDAAGGDRAGPGMTGPDPTAGVAPSVPPLCAAAVERAVEIRAAGTAAAREGLDELHRAAGAGGDPVAIATAAWRLLFDDRPGLTLNRRLQLERSCTAIDRARGSRGAGLHRLLSWMWAVACDLEDSRESVPVGMAPALGRHRQQPAPETLSYFVARLRSLARSERRAWRRARRADSAPGSFRGGTDG